MGGCVAAELQSEQADVPRLLAERIRGERNGAAAGAGIWCDVRQNASYWSAVSFPLGDASSYGRDVASGPAYAVFASADADPVQPASLAFAASAAASWAPGATTSDSRRDRDVAGTHATQRPAAQRVGAPVVRLPILAAGRPGHGFNISIALVRVALPALSRAFDCSPPLRLHSFRCLVSWLAARPIRPAGDLLQWRPRVQSLRAAEPLPAQPAAKRPRLPQQSRLPRPVPRAAARAGPVLIHACSDPARDHLAAELPPQRRGDSLPPGRRAAALSRLRQVRARAGASGHAQLAVRLLHRR